MHDLAPKSLRGDPQIKVADPLKWAFVLANAGSGKTTVLINRVARLLLRRPDGRPGAPPDTILCITYTKAAANEMLSRLFAKLGEWSLMDDEKLRGVLAALEQREVSDYTAEQLRDARSLFARALETPGGLRIETIHAFCARVLQRFPLEADVLPGFDQLETSDAADLWAGARRDAVLAAARDYPEALDRLALLGGHNGAEAVLDALFDRRTAAASFAAHFEDDAEKIAAFFRDRLDLPHTSADDYLDVALGDAFPHDAFASALQTLARSSKNDVRLCTKLSEFYAALSSSEKLDAYAHWAFDSKNRPRTKNAFTKAAAQSSNILTSFYAAAGPEGSEISRIRTVRETYAGLAAADATSALFQVGLPALKAYEAAKRQRGAVDFDDLIERTRHLLTRAGVADWVLYKLDGGLSHMLLDESQDTSRSQWDLIDALISEFGTGKGAAEVREPRTLFVVGDEKQSIYGFQGAAPERLIWAKRRYQDRMPGLMVETLETSFRSSPEILNFVDRVWNDAPDIEDTILLPEPEGAETGDIVHTAHRASEPGRVTLWPLRPPTGGDVHAPDTWRMPLDTLKEGSPKAQLAREIAMCIRDKIARGETVWDVVDGKRARRPMRYDDILILLRARTGGLFDAIIHALKQAHLPVSGADRLRLTEHIGVQDCLNLMRFAMAPSRDLVLAEILRGPFCGLVDDDRYLFELAGGRASRSETLWSRVQASGDPDVQAVRIFLDGLIARRDLPAFEFLSIVLTMPGVEAQTGWHRLQARLGPPVRDPVEALLQQAVAFDTGAASSLQTFVHAIESRSLELKRDLEAPAGEIRVMTVHGAKGLEAPVVFLPDTTSAVKHDRSRLLETEEALVWSAAATDHVPWIDRLARLRDVSAQQEHRRLLYVALTRAKDQLIIAGAWSGRKPSEDKSDADEGEDDSGKKKSGAKGYADTSWYALCVNAMTRLGIAPSGNGHLVFGADIPCADQKPGDATQAPMLAPFSGAPPEPAQARRFVAPSGLVARGAPVLSRASGRGAFGLTRGRLIHTLLQHLPDIGAQDRPKAIRQFLDSQAGLSGAQKSEIESSVQGVLTAPELTHLFQQGGRAEAAIIGTSPHLPAGLVINGRVDRLVVTDDSVLIVDYKTDEPPPTRPEDVPQPYLAQMAAYAAVLTEAYPGKTVLAVLCWTDGPRLMHLPGELLRKALAAVKASGL